MKAKERDPVFDWTRGLAILAVILDHYRIPGLSEAYFVWGVQGFVLITAALAAETRLTFPKVFRRLVYIFFIYQALVILFYPFHEIFDVRREGAFLQTFNEPVEAVLYNGYFAHLWYLALYAQMLVFFLFFQNSLRRASWKKTAAAALVISQAAYVLAHVVLGRFEQIFILSWAFTIASGWYAGPRLLDWIRENRRTAGKRCLFAFLALAAICSHPGLVNWLELQERQMFLPNTLFSFLVVYAFLELYYLLRTKAAFESLRAFIETMGRYSLVLYIYHQGIHVLFRYRDHGVEPNGILLALLAVPTGLLMGRLLNAAYSAAGRRLSAAAVALSFPDPRTGAAARDKR